MAELKTNISNKELSDIHSPEIIHIMKTIKAIQRRMKDPDISKLPYIHAYDTLAKEFSYFSDRYTQIFTMVVRGSNLNTLTAALYYKDKVMRGLMTEEQLSTMLKEKYLTPEQIATAEENLKKMRAEGKI